MQAPLRLDDIVVESLHVRAALHPPTAIEADATLPEPRVEVDILRAEDEARFMVPFSVRINQKSAEFSRRGYALDIKLVGYFSFDPGTDEEAMGRLITINAPAILYGVARGIAAQAFALTNAGRMLLPSVNFVEIMDRRERRLLRKAKTKSNEQIENALQP